MFALFNKGAKKWRRRSIKGDCRDLKPILVLVLRQYGESFHSDVLVIVGKGLMI